MTNHDFQMSNELGASSFGLSPALPSDSKKKIALVFGTVPSHEEIEQFYPYADAVDFTLVTSQSIADYVKDITFFNQLKILSLPDHDENPTFLPGLEKTLGNFDVVIVKERVGLYAYQALKAKWQSNFKLFVIVDNITPFPGEDIRQMQTIRDEVTVACDGLIVQSKLIESMLLDVENVPAEKLFYLTPYAEPRKLVGTKERVRALESLKLHDGDFLVVAFGQIEWEEGLLDIVHAMKYLGERGGHYDKIKLAICGVGSFDNDLVERISRLGIAHAVRVVEPSRAATIGLLSAADLVFYSTIQSRDRLEGDPFRLLIALTNGIPVLTGRSPLVEEIIGKHRIDFCIGSPKSIADGILRAKEASQLLPNIKTKNLNLLNTYFSKELANEDFWSLLQRAGEVHEPESLSSLYKQVLQVEGLVSKKSYPEAISMVERLLADPELPAHLRANLYRLIGDCFAKLTDVASAKESYGIALELDPFSSKAYLGTGVVLLGEQNFNGAVINFQKAVSYSPDDDMAHIGLGLAFQGLGENEEARNWLLSGLRVGPTNQMAIYSLVKLSNETGNYKGCVESLETFIELSPASYEMVYTLAGILFKMKKFEKARKYCESALNTPIDQEKVRDLHEMILARLNDKSEKLKSKLG